MRLNGLTSSDTLLEQILYSDNLKRAWKRGRANKGAPGIDGVSIDNFPQYLRDHWPDVLVQLNVGTYQPLPVRRVRIDKDDGGVRELGIPIILDRLIQPAIAQVLSPLFEPSFSEHSDGFRPKRSAHDAIQSVLAEIKLGRKRAIDVDLAKCFDRINHDLLMTQLGHRIKDKAVLQLIDRYLRAGINDNGTLLASRDGVPQGGPLSPLLSNVVLDLLDKELEHRGHHFARYADDFIILVRSQRAGERVLASITGFVQRHLKLQVNAHKSQVVPVSRAKFLGFCFPRNKVRCHPKS